MEIWEIVALALFVLPGILAEKISYGMDFPSAEKRSDFGEVINGMLLSLPIVFIAGIVMALSYGVNTLVEFIGQLNSISFLLIYSVLVLFVAIIAGIVKGLSENKLHCVVNKIRSAANKMKIDNKCCWRQAFLEENVSRYVKIIKDGVVLSEGFVKHYSLPNEDMGIVLEDPEGMDYYKDKYPEYKDNLPGPCRIYINIEKGVIVEAYDTAEIDKYLRDLNKGPR